ncbi:MinD/ParA family protein [Thiohalobacter thiocyanaticus]|uniref:MinD/ParA family protein n=1 Tax=Thiohalobacter thiocyanaticus TaxID=585455 RepID=A0A426QMC6_9GAMM|nr:MinD/ParA family protein [Thiohalobacter thiocyanaticus]RRQ22922.1 MinD/ParA family protein [Thiohalobacter thiocyanaticus]
MTRVITISSGKGGVGKTFIAVNLAVEAARRGLKVCLFDADLGLANVDILLKLQPERTLVDVIEGRCALRDILLSTEFGVDVVPGSSGVDVMANLPPDRLQPLQSQFEVLKDYDLVLFDTSSGIGRGVMSIILASPEVCLVITPEPTSLTDAYGMVKLLYRDGFKGQLSVIVNNARTNALAEHTFERFREVARVYLQRSLPLQGVVPFDSRVGEAIRQQRPFLVSAPDAPAARRLAALAERLLSSTAPAGDGIEHFWQGYLERLAETGAETAQTVAAPVAAEPSAEVYPGPELIHQLTARLEELSSQVQALSTQFDTARSAPGASPAQSVPAADEEAGPERREGVIRLPRGARHARSLRQGRRPTPIDSLQLRRITGRLLLRAQEQAGGRVTVDTASRELEEDNSLHLVPGRYTCIALALEAVEQPRQFVSDVLEICEIDGCDVRELTSSQHLWLTSDRDGCIKLDASDAVLARLEIYVMAGQAVMEDGMQTMEQPVPPQPARLARTAVSGSVWPRLAEHHRDRLVREAELSDADMDVYRLKRFGRSPLFCAVMRTEVSRKLDNGSKVNGAGD